MRPYVPHVVAGIRFFLYDASYKVAATGSADNERYTMTATMTSPRTYTAAQQAARDYMEAQNILDDLSELAKPHKAAQNAALDILTDEYGENVKAMITGCWNVPLTFLHRIDDRIKWAKVVEALRPHLTAEQTEQLDTIIEANTGTRLNRKVSK